MPIYEFKCPLCGERTEDTSNLVGLPCPNRSCEGALRRVYSLYSLYIKPVDGGGGSPGRRISQ